MQSKNWGAFLCDCRSTLNVDQKKIEASFPLFKVATNPEEEIDTFANEAENEDIEHVLVDAVPNHHYLNKYCQEKHFTSWI